MSNVKVSYRFIKMTPRKVRLVADMIRGKSAEWAKEQLGFLNKAASRPVLELLNSGMAAAKDKDLKLENLIVSQICVNEGPKLKRQRLNSRARASMVIKRMAHLILVLSDEVKNIPKQSIKEAKGAKNGSKSKSN